MECKDSIRKAVLSKRKALKAQEIIELSSAILSRVISGDEYKQAQWIFTYINFGSEVMTSPLIERAISDGKRVAVPIAEPGGRNMYFVEIHGVGGLKRMPFGVLEPEGDISMQVIPNSGCMFLAPGAAFDRNGGRLGYGRGYYDEYFRKYGVENTNGLAFELQMVDEVPMQEHDVPLARIITEKEIYTTKG